MSSQALRFCNIAEFPDGSVVRNVLDRIAQQQQVSSQDFYIIRNGRLSDLDEPLQHGAIYHLEPRLYGGKGGFGSMLRALGAQIEKTTNREACRDLSGRRLRDVNHEKEMGEWLKKQAEREAEKEQRRLERLQRKLAEPKHLFTDPQYQQQCHDMSERLEESVLKGLQASSSPQVKADDSSPTKRPNSEQSEQPAKKKMKTEKRNRTEATCYWTGVGELLSSEEEEEDHDEDETERSPSTSRCGATAVKMMQQGKEAEPGPSSSSGSSSSSSPSRSPETITDQNLPKTPINLKSRPSDDQTPPESPKEQNSPFEDQKPSEGPKDPNSRTSENQKPGEVSRDLKNRASEEHKVPEITEELKTSSSEDQKPAESSKPAQAKRSPQQVDLSSLTSVQQLEALGLDVLKEELMSRGLKCGGTLSERAARLLAVKGLSPDQIDPSLLAKPAKSRKK